MKKKLIFTEIMIILVIMLGLLLPRIIGKTEIEVSDGYINEIDALNGHTIGITTKGEEEGIVLDYLPDSAIIKYDSIDESINAFKENKIDALVTNQIDARSITDDNDDLVIYQLSFQRKHLNTYTNDDLYYFVVRKQDCAYQVTTKSIEDAYKPGTKIACLTGVIAENKFDFIDSDCIFEYYYSFVDVYNALAKNKVDYCVGFDDNVEEILPSFPNVAAIPDAVHIDQECLALSKNEKGSALTKEFDGFIGEILQSEKYSELFEKWKNDNKEECKLEAVNYTGENGILKICTNGAWFPYTFINNNEISGVLIDICNIFCERMGYIPEYYISDFAGEIAGLASGEYDIMADVCEPTEERKQSVNLTRPIMVSKMMVFTRSDGATLKTVSKASVFFNSIKEQFYKNFIEQDRYKLIVDGLWTTVKISLASALLGTLLGMLICAMRMSSNNLLSAFSRIYIKFIQGTPIVVLLLILYYVVFSNVGITGFYVSIIAFSIDFAAYVSEIFRSGIESIPKGQTTAARALGFSSIQAFIKVVFPQSLINIVPVYNGQFISLIKSTSVVGYIAVQDLTKMSDLIRSATYEAFFPLISTALIYFILSSLIIQLLKNVTNKIDPLNRPRTIKGVKTDVI